MCIERFRRHRRWYGRKAVRPVQFESDDRDSRMHRSAGCSSIWIHRGLVDVETPTKRTAAYTRWRNGSGMQMPPKGRHRYARVHAYVTCNVACHVNARGPVSFLVGHQSAAKFSGSVGVTAKISCLRKSVHVRIYFGPIFSILRAEAIFLWSVKPAFSLGFRCGSSTFLRAAQ